MTVRDSWWIAAREPIRLAFVLGCVVSLMASGRVSARLVLDGALSFAFVPIVEVAAFAVVYRRGTRPMPFVQALDRFFATNAAWLAILAGLAVIAVAQTPQQMAPWTAPPKLWLLAAIGAGGITWSALADLRFFHNAFGRSRREAIGDTLVFRAVAWPLGTLYFFGFAAWPLLIAWTRG